MPANYWIIHSLPNDLWHFFLCVYFSYSQPHIPAYDRSGYFELLLGYLNHYHVIRYVPPLNLLFFIAERKLPDGLSDEGPESGLQTGPGIKKPTLVITDLYDQTGHFWAPSHTPIDSHKPLWDKGRRGSFALLPSETHLLEGYFPTLWQQPLHQPWWHAQQQLCNSDLVRPWVSCLRNFSPWAPQTLW